MQLRKNRSDAGKTTNAEAGRGRRSGRGWGPFSGAQLTVIIVAIAVMVMLPVGAFAVVSGTNSFVTDSTTGKTAGVNVQGQLNVNEGVTGTVATGTMTVDPATTVSLFTNVDVRRYAGMRLMLSETGANPAAQTVNIFSSVVPYVLDNFVMNTNNISRYYQDPGLVVSLQVSNFDSNPATYTWRVYARSN